MCVCRGVCVCVCVVLTEALVEALSSSLLVGGAAPLRERGDEAGALRLDLGGLVESSYSSARAKRSLNLQGMREPVKREPSLRRQESPFTKCTC